MRSTFFAVMGLLLLAEAGVIAQGRWDMLGEARVDGEVDHNRIVLAAVKNEYRAIQFRVQRAPITFDRAVVYFGNGKSEQLKIDEHVSAGGQTRVLDLPGEKRAIQSAEFWYLRANWGKNVPQVRLWGMR